jgi:hypothetical protein
MKSIAVLAVLLFALPAATQTEQASLCVASRAATPYHLQGNVAGGRDVKLRLDKGLAVEWPQTKSLKLMMDIDKRYLLAIIDVDGKPWESMWFRFSDYSSNALCMAYDGYQGIQMQEQSRHTPWCKCK